MRSLTDDARFTATIERLNRQSLERRHDAFLDIAWDSPDLALDPADPRLCLPSFDPLAQTEWYRGLPVATQARVGLHRIAGNMRIGLEFENMLQRGLLDFAFRLPAGAPEFRYVLHEVIEETQHTLMFQEFVNRAGVEAPTMPRWSQVACSQFVLPLAWAFPELFFMFVLGGEEPVDHLQRRFLRDVRDDGTGPHPLVAEIMTIHLTEEARHIGFARSYLKTAVPRLGPVRRRVLAVAAPALLGIMVPMMTDVSPATAREFGLPRHLLRSVARSDQARQIRRDSVRKIRTLCHELGLMTPTAVRVWKRVGLWAPPVTDPAG